MKAFVPVVVGVSLCLGCGKSEPPSAGKSAPSVAAKSDQESIQGTWALESVESNGKSAPAEDIKNRKVSFTGDRVAFLSVHDGKEAKWELIFKLDPSTKPKGFDMEEDIQKTKEMYAKKGIPVVGVYAVLGIYSLEGDTLKICLAPPRAQRPKEFTSQNQDLFVLKRAK
jgi:uncharacterized protein (TIGR03067 family)